MVCIWVVVLVVTWAETTLGARSCSDRPVAACSCWNPWRSTITCVDAGLTRFPEFTTNYIHRLDLSNNNITLRPDDKLGREGQVITKLILSRSFSRQSDPTIPWGFFNGSQQYIKWFDISRNYLSAIPNELRTLEELKHLDLSNNKIIYFGKYDFVNFLDLEVLYLAGNPIESVHSEAFKLSRQLRSLSLTLRCRLQSRYHYDKLTQYLTNLTSLHIKRTRRNNHKETFFRTFKNLERLKIESSSEFLNDMLQFHQIGIVFAPFSKTLKVLSLADTSINSNYFGNSDLRDFRKLEIIDLSRNGLEELGQTDKDFHVLAPLPALRTLNLQHNRFDSLDKVYDPYILCITKPNLMIDLRNNRRIKTLPDKLCHAWSETRIKLLLDSPMVCTSCDSIGWVWGIKEGNYSTFNSCIHRGNDALICKKPASFKNKSIFQRASLC